MPVTNEQYISEYLKHLDYHGSTTPCLEALNELHRQHTYHVPFENLALLGDYTPNLERDHLFDWIVNRSRGGVCYELNTSFYQLLSALGFSCDQISGAVNPGESMFAHVSTLVHLPEGDYIVDVGFAGSALPPLKVDGNPATVCNGCEFQVTDQGDNVVLITRHASGQEPKRMYAVSLEPRRMSDYFGQYRWASAKGNTIFSEYPICAFQTPERRIVLRGGKLIVERDGRIVENRPIAPGEETERVLREYFDLP